MHTVFIQIHTNHVSRRGSIATKSILRFLTENWCASICWPEAGKLYHNFTLHGSHCQCQLCRLCFWSIQKHSKYPDSCHSYLRTESSNLWFWEHERWSCKHADQQYDFPAYASLLHVLQHLFYEHYQKVGDWCRCYDERGINRKRGSKRINIDPSKSWGRNNYDQIEWNRLLKSNLRFDLLKKWGEPLR